MTNTTDWTGRIGDVWAAEWRRTDRSFGGLAPFLDAAILAAATTSRPRTVVDVGCGAGATSLATARAVPDAQVVGIDLSEALIATAERRALDQAQANARFVRDDVVRAANRHAPVDLYVSRHGVMFFADPVAAFTELGGAARLGAMLVFSCFAERAANRWAIETIAAVGGNSDTPVREMPGPFAFADAAHVGAILARSGWQAEPPVRIEFAYRAGEGPDAVADAVDYFRRIGPAASAIRDAAPEERERHIARLTMVCERHVDGDTVEFPAAAWIWTARKSANQITGEPA